MTEQLLGDPVPDGDRRAADQHDLADVLIAFSRNLVVGDYDVADVLSQVCDAAVRLLPVTGAGVMLADEAGHLRFAMASDERISLVEALQVDLDDGPCRHAYLTGEQVVVPDLAATDRFPRFGPPALSAGLRGVYSFPMRAPGQLIGALNFYRDEPGDFTGSDREVGQVLADVASAYTVSARQYEEATRLSQQLQRALDSRVVIEQAKGRLVEQLGVSLPDAFELLRRQARSHQTKIHSVAEQVVAGALHLSADR